MGCKQPRKKPNRRRRPKGKCRFHNRPHKKWASREEAERECAAMQRRYPGWTYKVFSCRGCPWYHVGRDWDGLPVQMMLRRLIGTRRRVRNRAALDKFLRMRVEMYG